MNGALINERRKSYRALVVEDDHATAVLVKTVLEREGFSVEAVGTGEEAIELLKAVAYDLLIVDLILPLIRGDVVIEHLAVTQPQSVRRVIVTTASPRSLSCELLQRICRVLEKPFDIDRLILYARECMDAPAA